MKTTETIFDRKEIPLLCGVDLGGTKIAIALVERNGTIRGRRRIRDHEGLHPQEIVIINSNLPGFAGFPLGERLESELGVPIFGDPPAGPALTSIDFAAVVGAAALPLEQQ